MIKYSTLTGLTCENKHILNFLLNSWNGALLLLSSAGVNFGGNGGFDFGLGSRVGNFKSSYDHLTVKIPKTIVISFSIWYAFDRMIIRRSYWVKKYPDD